MSNFLSQLMLRSWEADKSYERKQEEITVTTMLKGELFEVFLEAPLWLSPDSSHLNCKW